MYNNIDINLITLAAGLGTRTINRSQLPKPFQKVKNKMIIEWSLTSYQYLINKRVIKPKNLYFAILEKHQKEFNVIKILKKTFGNSIKIIILKKITKGPMETALIVSKKIKNDNPIIINDSDHYFDGKALYNSIHKLNFNSKYQGIINTTVTNSKKPDWSYVNTNKNNKIIGVKEKDPNLAKSGAKGIVGSYYFAKKSVFENEAKKFLKKSLTTECFISSILDKLIKGKKEFLQCNTSKIYPLGNYTQIKSFENKFKFKKFYPEPKTIIVDYDGVLVKHDGGYVSNLKKYTYPAKAIKKNQDLIKKEYEEGNYIIIMTGRSNSEKKRLKKELLKFKIYYHQLITGVASGPRIVINDLKKKYPDIKTAIAITIKRNSLLKKI